MNKVSIPNIIHCNISKTSHCYFGEDNYSIEVSRLFFGARNLVRKMARPQLGIEPFFLFFFPSSQCSQWC